MAVSDDGRDSIRNTRYAQSHCFDRGCRPAGGNRNPHGRGLHLRAWRLWSGAIESEIPRGGTGISVNRHCRRAGAPFGRGALMAAIISALLMGALFAAGLLLSGMTDPKQAKSTSRSSSALHCLAQAGRSPGIAPGRRWWRQAVYSPTR